MATAMKGVTKALTQMNKKINLPGLQKIMAEFMKENEKADITAEMIGDTLDDAMEEEGTAEEEERIVGQVLDELGVSMGQELGAVPMGAVAASAPAQADAAQGMDVPCFPVIVWLLFVCGSSSLPLCCVALLDSVADSAVSDLEARLAKLK